LIQSLSLKTLSKREIFKNQILLMKLLIALSIILSGSLFLVTHVSRSDAIPLPFDYNIIYDLQSQGLSYHFNGNTHDDIPVLNINETHTMNYHLNLSIKRDLKDIVIIIAQEYYCKTNQISDTEYDCGETLLEPMTGNSSTVLFFDNLTEGQNLLLNLSYNASQEECPTLDITHLIVMHCPDKFCLNHLDEFFQHYDSHYSFQLNRTVYDDKNFPFKWGHVILDDPFAGIWCPIK